MTEKYWIKQRIKVEDPILEALTEALNDSRHDQDQLQLDIIENKALPVLLKVVVKFLGFKLRWKRESSSEKKTKTGVTKIYACPSYLIQDLLLLFLSSSCRSHPTLIELKFFRPNLEIMRANHFRQLSGLS